MLSLRQIGLAAAAFAVITSTASAQLDPVNPFNGPVSDGFAGAPGNTFTLVGENLPTSKVKARLINPDTGKRVKGTSLKVTEATEMAVTIEIRKSCAGEWQVELKGKDFDTGLTENGDMEPITIGFIGPILASSPTPAGSTFEPGETVMYDVFNMGTKKPSIKVGGKKARVSKDFTTESNVSTIEVRLSKKQGDGFWNHEMKTKHGDETLGRIFEVTNENEKQNRLKKPGIKIRNQLLDTMLDNPLKAKGSKSRKVNIGGKALNETTVSEVDGTNISGSKGKNKKLREFMLNLPTGSDLVEGQTFSLDGGAGEDATLNSGEDRFGDNNGSSGLGVYVEAVQDGRAQLFLMGGLEREDSEGDALETQPDTALVYGTVIIDQEAPEPKEE